MKKILPLKIALAQINPTVGAFDANLKKIESFIYRADRSGSDMVIFPEMSVCGYPVWDLANKNAFVRAGMLSLDRIVALSKNVRTAIVLGFIDYGSKPGLYRNALAFIENGRILHKQHKTLLPNYDVFLEKIYFEPSDSQRVFKWRGVKVGTTICEDIWDENYPEKPAQELKSKGAELLINISASPYHQHVPQIRDTLIRRIASSHQMWVIYVNQAGGQDDLVFDGRSMIANPEGKIVHRSKPFEEVLDLVSIRSQRSALSHLPKTDNDRTAEIYQALVMGIRDYVHKNHFKRVALGLSGGIDSALVATLAADALGARSVVGVTMPGEFSSVGSYRDSEKLAGNLGIEMRRYPIKEHYRQFVKNVRQLKKKHGMKPAEAKSITLAMENLQARLRGLQLMYISNDENCLVLSTGNKSELAMGYCTLYGDMCGGLAVIGDVYKTDVYKLVRFRNAITPVIPEAIVKKAPSAELRPNQKDQDSLPPYDVLDGILRLYIEKDFDERQIEKALTKRHVSLDLIRQVIRKVDRNEYKRRQTPPLIRVSEKAWFGRRMPITNRFS